ncbi:MAG: tryptophan 7-halogenase, partial [Chroococcidiopsidaceae cyanobacterium CP_BM_ER_R8_30]|nr:tryptophan 7-halogenase [Chroococcidiopsidaceae cyanobacterium CP_BM_ER_R8_30]
MSTIRTVSLSWETMLTAWKHSSDSSHSHAIVIGGGIAGLLAARVLSDYFSQVTIVERDRLPEQPVPRRGVPQSYQLHVLLTQGYRILEQLFPGLEAELAEQGAPCIDWLGDCPLLLGNNWAPRSASDLRTRACTRN